MTKLPLCKHGLAFAQTAPWLMRDMRLFLLQGHECPFPVLP